ncbi:glutamine--scyllo-inositol aminotransferase [Sphaerisporangium siamense]|uniref:dTDP-4-amino-4,6-dideoxygalactose transaminase n=1 Tax=Sphaerisporangium siamense TaxID=795645 RepID=A0A7W7D2G3_9ACTN|nr:DegT/DnrJ/EryC1/StrS family aminotransferase [Sphaerisporangium siamense]MBB4698896.1 dTDP-4-amino-4,6-dideoxygalactose transaminase [Sphaerisporangium siamense]GII89081.1 glutamine--scyllo-inositol aminotransferase [Sphaerisporangium siamense]
MIPFVDLRAAHAEVADEVQQGFDRVLQDTAFVQGPDVAAFEQEYAEFSGVPHCVGVGNGTDAIELCLRAAGLEPGSGAVLPANTFVATAEAVVRAGLRPVLADCDDDHLLIDPAAAEAAIGPDTAAVLPVHLYGQQAPMAAVHDLAARHGLTVVEDAAQSQGSLQEGRPPVGLASTSFYPGKNLGAYGEAGAVLTSSPELATAVRLLTNHGSRHKYQHETLGFNSRLDTLQAVVLRAKLKRLARWNELRRAAAERYDKLLSGVEGVRLPRVAPGNLHVWHLYVIRVPQRDKVMAGLHAAGVQAQIHYPYPVHLTPAFRDLGYGPGDFPVAEKAATEILSLPMHPHLTPSQQERVTETLDKVLSSL